MQRDDSYQELATPFDQHITEKTEEDVAVWNAIKTKGLLYEKPDRSFIEMLGDFLKQRDPYEPERLRVNAHLRNNGGAVQRIVQTVDNVNIATLTRVVQNARATIMYVTGYFMNQTPPKSWPAPFYEIFDDCNIVSFDWRSVADSDGKFSKDAVNDVRAVLRMIKNDPVLSRPPLLLSSFCMGGALALEALVGVQRDEPELMPDALSMSCTQSRINLDRALWLSPNRVMTTICRIGLMTTWSRNFMVRKLFDPVLEKMHPIERLPEIRIPVCFEHCTKKDLFAPIQDCYENYDAAFNAPLRYIIASDVAGHARLHKDTPLQYRDALFDFLEKALAVKKKAAVRTEL